MRRTGFGSLLDFSQDKILHGLAYQALKSFDPSTRSLKISGKKIQITDRDVHHVFGFPIGPRSFEYATTADRKNLWSSQFPGKP